MSELAIVVGITGPPCAGKGVIKDYLLEIAQRQGLTVQSLSFSGILLEEALRLEGAESADFDRSRLTEIAGRLREERGNDVLACLVADEIERSDEERAQFYVVEALRHRMEADRLEARFGSRFFLIAVTAPPEVMVRRIMTRARSNESPDALRSAEAAKELIQRELDGDGSPHSISVNACMSRAQAVIQNAGTLQELREEVEAVFLKILDRSGRSG